MEKACFFDRDGVLIEEENYLADPARVRLCPGAAEAVLLMRRHGYKIIVTSNQSGIARGYFTEDDLKAVEARLNALLAVSGAYLDASYYCFHHPKGIVAEYARDCDCRKPKPGMLLRAAAEWNLNPGRSVMIGDKLSDIEAGVRAGCRLSALVRTGHGAEQDVSGLSFPFVEAPGVLEAARGLLARVAH